jgi:hypothetical protein
MKPSDDPFSETVPKTAPMGLRPVYIMRCETFFTTV